jgi:hypothetical protein
MELGCRQSVKESLCGFWDSCCNFSEVNQFMLSLTQVFGGSVAIRQMFTNLCGGDSSATALIQSALKGFSVRQVRKEMNIRVAH